MAEKQELTKETQKVDTAIKITKDYLDALSSLGHRCSWEKDAISAALLYPDEDAKKAGDCVKKFLQVYNEWGAKLHLTYQPWEFHLHQMWEDKNGLFIRIEKVKESLETLRDEAGEEVTLPWKKKVERFAKEYKWLIELIASVIARVWKTP